MNAARLGTAALIAAVGVVLLAGCGGAATTSAPTPDAPSTTPTPTPVAPASTPEPVIDLTCADLATPTLSGLIPDTNRLQLDPWLSLPGREITPNGPAAVRTAGGLFCAWVVKDSPWDDARRAAASVTILPAESSQFEAWAGSVANLDLPCELNWGTCQKNEFINGFWVETAVFETPMDSFDAYTDEVHAVVAAAGPSTSTWVPDTTLPRDCDAFVTGPEVATSLGLGIDVRTRPRTDIWNLADAADEEVGSLRCIWRLAGSGDYMGVLDTLPGGRWAWDEVRNSLTTPSTPVEFAVPGLDSTDEAWLRCREKTYPDDVEKCVVDLLVGNDWIEVQLDTTKSSISVSYDMAAGTLALSTTIVENLARSAG